MTVPTPGINEVECPHCGHVVEPVGRCSSCGMRLKKRAGRKRLGAALLIAAVGVVLLQHGAKKRNPPLISINRISPLMNFKTVRVEGLLESGARELRSGSVLYVVDDGTGVLSVFSDVVPDEKLPRAGSRVAAIGTLSVGVGNNVRMQAGHIELLEEPPADNYISEFRLSDITAELMDVRITAFGTVSKVWKPRPGSKAPYRIILEDPSGTLDVVHWLKTPPEVAIGDAIEVIGVVGMYKEQLQLRLWNTDDLQPLKEEPGPAIRMPIGDISAEMEGNRVIAEGVLGEPRSIPGGVIYPFTDSSGTIQALFWDKQIPGEERDALDEGVSVRIEAPVVLYKGILELVPEDLGGFRVLD